MLGMLANLTNSHLIVAAYAYRLRARRAQMGNASGHDTLKIKIASIPVDERLGHLPV